jgi:hypothetical protein
LFGKIQPVLRNISILGLGVVGNSDGIYEVDLGFEAYLRKGVFPVKIITYVERPCGEKFLVQLIDALKSVYPYEHPMIELVECSLYVRNGPV